jgi:hypothetical protein
MNVFDIPMIENDADASTIGEYFSILLAMVWKDKEGFSGKRPFGNSGWDHEVYASLVKAGVVEGKFDEDGYLSDCNYNKADKLIYNAILDMFKQ